MCPHAGALLGVLCPPGLVRGFNSVIWRAAESARRRTRVYADGTGARSTNMGYDGAAGESVLR